MNKPSALKMLEEYKSSAPDKNRVSVNTATTVVKSQAEVEFEKKTKSVISLLAPLVVVPQANGEMYIKYLIEDKLKREQLEDWLLYITKKHYKLP